MSVRTADRLRVLCIGKAGGKLQGEVPRDAGREIQVEALAARLAQIAAPRIAAGQCRVRLDVRPIDAEDARVDLHAVARKTVLAADLVVPDRIRTDFPCGTADAVVEIRLTSDPQPAGRRSPGGNPSTPSDTACCSRWARRRPEFRRHRLVLHRSRHREPVCRRDDRTCHRVDVIVLVVRPAQTGDGLQLVRDLEIDVRVRAISLFFMLSVSQRMYLPWYNPMPKMSARVIGSPVLP